MVMTKSVDTHGVRPARSRARHRPSRRGQPPFGPIVALGLWSRTYPARESHDFPEGGDPTSPPRAVGPLVWARAQRETKRCGKGTARGRVSGPFLRDRVSGASRLGCRSGSWRDSGQEDLMRNNVRSPPNADRPLRGLRARGGTSDRWSTPAKLTGRRKRRARRVRAPSRNGGFRSRSGAPRCAPVGRASAIAQAETAGSWRRTPFSRWSA